MFGLGYQELLIVLVIVLVLFGANRLPPFARSLGVSVTAFKAGNPRKRRLAPRLTMFICGAIAGQATSFLYAQGFAGPSWPVMLQGGLAWTVLFEVVYRTRGWFRPLTMPIYAVAVWFAAPALGIVLSLAMVAVQGRMTHQLLAFYSDPATWVPNPGALADDWVALGSAAVFVVLSYVLINGVERGRSEAMNVGGVWSGCKGGDMLPSKSQTTRLLCASAFLSGTSFRNHVLSYLENEHHAVSPELGVDMGTVATVCQYVKRRARRFELYLFLGLIAGAIATLADVTLGVVVFVVITAAIYFKKTYGEQIALLSKFRRENFGQADPGKFFSAELEPEVLSALPREDQNLIVYTGFTPFIGAGVALGGWSFAVDVCKADGDLGHRGAPRRFELEELYEALVQKVSESNVSGLAIKDVFFVNGREIRDDREILPDVFRRPLQYLDPVRAQRYVAASDSRVRHYKWIRVHDWDQELVMSYFLRCSLRGNHMFVEINRFLLTPLADQYRRIDAIAKPKTRHTLGLLTGALFAGPIYAVITPFLLLGHVHGSLGRRFNTEETTRRRSIEEDPRFDYGAGQGLRQAFSSGQFEHYFQKADGDFYAKMLEQAVLDGIITFLEEHQIDTSALRERRTMILNSGILVQGGDVKAESLAVGAGAQAVTNQPVPRAKGKGAGA